MHVNIYIRISNTYEYIHIYFSQYRNGGLGQQFMSRVKEIFPLNNNNNNNNNY